MKLRTLDDLDVANKRVLLRADFNVPLKDGAIVDDMRIRATLPTIKELLDRGASQIVACSHLGRPKGERNMKYSLAPVAERLRELLGEDVPLIQLDDGATARVSLLENLRFDPREERNDISFATQLASHGDLYVDDAFGAVHRAHASVSAVAELLPNAAGRLLAREVEVLTRLIDSPERPFLAIVGGAKVSDKLDVLDRLLALVDRLAIGGAMAFTFLAAKGYPTGRSLMEIDRIADVTALMEKAGDRLLLPTDIIVASEIKEGVVSKQVAAAAIPDDLAGYDIGSETCRAYVDAVRDAKTVFWNGPMGVFEIKGFDQGTRAVAAAIAKGKAFSVVGGGDSGAALKQFGYDDEVDHLSTGGGASLEFLEGKELPGLLPLKV